MLPLTYFESDLFLVGRLFRFGESEEPRKDFTKCKLKKPCSLPFTVSRNSGWT